MLPAAFVKRNMNADPPQNDFDAPADTRPPRSRLRLALTTGLPLALLGFILWYTDWADMFDHARRADPLLLFSAFMLYQLVVLIQGWRWQIVAASDGEHWPIGRMQFVNYVSMFFDSFTPGKLGSDAYRLAAMRRPGKVHHLVMSLLALRLHGMAANFVVSGVVGTIVLTVKHGWLKAAVPGAVIALVLFLAVRPAYNAARRGTLHIKRTRAGFAQALALQIQKAHDAIRSMFADRRTRRASNALVLIYTMAIVAVYWLVGRAFGMTLPFANYLAVVPLLVLASVIPISIQGRGLTEALAIGLWQGARASQEQILLTCLTVFAVMIVQGLIGGAIWVATRHRAASSHQHSTDASGAPRPQAASHWQTSPAAALPETCPPARSPDLQHPAVDSQTPPEIGP